MSLIKFKLKVFSLFILLVLWKCTFLLFFSSLSFLFLFGHAESKQHLLCSNSTGLLQGAESESSPEVVLRSSLILLGGKGDEAEKTFAVIGSSSQSGKESFLVSSLTSVDCHISNHSLSGCCDFTLISKARGGLGNTAERSCHAAGRLRVDFWSFSCTVGVLCLCLCGRLQQQSTTHVR